MLKILLVYDDFQELTSVELMLKKIGFDVVGITSEFSLAEQLLSFNPQIVVAQGRTAKVSTANVGRRLRESLRWDGQCILIFYPNAKPQPTELLRIRMDVGLEYPVEPTKIVQVLAQLGNLDANQLIDKLIKSLSSEPASTGANTDTHLSQKSENESVFVSGGKQANESNTNPIGGINPSDSKTMLSPSGSPRETLNQALKGNQSGNEEKLNLKGQEPASSSPLFPLSSKNQDSNLPLSNVQGAKTNAEPNELKGGFGTTFQLDQMVKDPIMQELENLLKGKPSLALDGHPLIQDPVRHKKYDEYMKTIPIQQLSSIKRTQAKSRLRDLIKDIDKHELEDQDVLRREYVKALFKKEG